MPGGAVLLVDGYEQLAPIDGWMRDDFVPGLSASNVVVLAGRDPPSAPWRTDAGWRHLVAVHRLEPSTRTKAGNCSLMPASDRRCGSTFSCWAVGIP